MVGANELFGLQQRLGVGASAARQEPRNPRIATELRLFMKAATDPPNHGIPPVNGADNQFHPVDPMVSTFQVGQFMVDDRPPPDLIQLRPERCGQDETRPSTA